MAKKMTKKISHPQLPAVKKVVKKRAPRMKKQVPRQAPAVTIQPHISIALESNHRPGHRKMSSLGNNTITPNKKIKSSSKASRYGSTSGLPGPAAAFDAPIVRRSPIAVSDIRQALANAPNNEVPHEFGVINKNRMPMQTIISSNGGKFSGRTGPIR